MWPTYCFICQKVNLEQICATCQSCLANDPAIALLPTRCYQCASRIPSLVANQVIHPLCGRCISHPPAFDQTLVFADYVNPYAGLVARLKFGAHLELVPLLSSWLLQAIQTQAMNQMVTDGKTIITAVPMSANHLLERGFNHAWLLAKEVAKHLPYQAEPTLLTKVRETAPQVGLSRQERINNLKNAFAATNPSAFQAIEQVIVIDDVLTTGTTLHEMARVLKRQGVKRVVNVVLLRAIEK